MHLRNLTLAGGLVVALCVAQEQVVAQSKPVNAKPDSTTSQNYKAPRTVDGQPDLQGVWANNVATPLQRPKELADKPFLTNDELAAFKKAAAELFSGQADAAFGDSVFQAVLDNIKGTKKGFVSTDGKTGDYSSVWTVERDWTNRTSLITDPSDGRLPKMTERAQELAKRPSYVEGSTNGKRPDSYEELGLSLRCITFGSPSFFAGYNSYYQIAQSAKSVAIEMEKIHDARIIPTDGSPHLPPSVKLWHGDSRGHWEGDTLVIDTTNYRENVVMNNSEKLHVIERFTRTGPDVLTYKVTLDDPGTWEKPWTAEIPLRHSKDALYEYACHEGNYGLEGILAGARAEDAAEVQAAKKR